MRADGLRGTDTVQKAFPHPGQKPGRSDEQQGDRRQSGVYASHAVQERIEPEPPMAPDQFMERGAVRKHAEGRCDGEQESDDPVDETRFSAPLFQELFDNVGDKYCDIERKEQEGSQIQVDLCCESAHAVHAVQKRIHVSCRDVAAEVSGAVPL